MSAAPHPEPARGGRHPTQRPPLDTRHFFIETVRSATGTTGVLNAEGYHHLFVGGDLAVPATTMT